MRCRILHELPGRLRIHMEQSYMTIQEADLLEAYLKEVPEVTTVKVSERTSNAVICFNGQVRERILNALADFDYDTTAVSVPEHSGRALQHEYMDQMALRILGRGVSNLFLPSPVRAGISILKSGSFLLRGIRCLLNRQLRVEVLDAASILVSLLRQDYDTAGQVMFLLGIGDLMEEWIHHKSVNDLAAAMALNVDKVWRKLDGGTELLTDIRSVGVGDRIVVRTGNMIPLDGEAVEGDAMVNQASFTGEPLPVHKSTGSYLYAGSVVEEGSLVICVRKESGSGRYDRIVSMIESTEKLKSSAETKASRLADRLVPWTFGAALAAWLTTRDVTRASSILMVDFCCALKLSMPIAVLSAIHEAGNHHISVKGGKFLEPFAQAETMVFDKTGTLTVASPTVKAVIPFGGQDEAEVLRLAACLEEHYPHSVARAVVRSARERDLEHEERHSKVEYVVAHGIASSVDGVRVCIGSHHFIFEDEGCTVPEGEVERLASLPDEFSHLYLAVGGVLAAVLLIEDPMKPEAAQAIQALRAQGISRLVMMTGDNERTARAVAAQVGLDEVYAEVLPEDKAQFIQREHQQGRTVIMIGDGVNDSPALSASDVGVAINSGAAIAREIADITISENDLMSLVTLRQLSEALMNRINQNYHIIIGFNSLLIGLGVLGILPPAVTALAHNTSTIAIGLKSMTNLLPEARFSPDAASPDKHKQ